MPVSFLVGHSRALPELADSARRIRFAFYTDVEMFCFSTKQHACTYWASQQLNRCNEGSKREQLRRLTSDINVHCSDPTFVQTPQSSRKPLSAEMVYP